MSFSSPPPPHYQSVTTHTGQTSKSKLKRLLLRPNNINSISSLINDKTSKMLNSHEEAMDTWNYLRPCNQVVLLLQKGQEFPAYPHELSQSIEEKTWYSRMEELKKALKAYWSWVEKVLFTFAFVASVTIPWPIISAVTRYIDQQSNSGNSDDSGPSSSPSSQSPSPSSSPNSSSSSSSDAHSKTASAVASTLTASAKFIRRQLDNASSSASPSPSSDNYSSDYSSDLADPSGVGSNGDWANSQAWGDGYNSEMRWAAIAILLGILIAVWLPWIFVSIRNNRRVAELINGWNETDEQLGHMRALSWSLNKAPAMSSSKLLIIALPPGMHQPPSIFHSNAYPPSYGFVPRGSGGLPGYPADGVDPYGGAYGDDKGGFMAPPTMFGPPPTGDRKIEEIEDEDADAARRKSRDEDNDTILEGYGAPGSLDTIKEADEESDSASRGGNDMGRKRSDTASTAASAYTTSTTATVHNPLERAYSDSRAAADKSDNLFERMKPIRASTTSCMGATGRSSRPVSSASDRSDTEGPNNKRLSLNDIRSPGGTKYGKDAKKGGWV